MTYSEIVAAHGFLELRSRMLRASPAVTMPASGEAQETLVQDRQEQEPNRFLHFSKDVNMCLAMSNRSTAVGCEQTLADFLNLYKNCKHSNPMGAAVSPQQSG